MQSENSGVSQETLDTSQSNRGRENKLEDYYIKSIQAKLNLISKIEGFTK